MLENNRKISKTSTKEKSDFLEFNQFVRNIEEEAVNRKIVIVEYISIFLTLACFVLTAILAYDDKSVTGNTFIYLTSKSSLYTYWIFLKLTALAISIDSFLDILAYVVCIWRYHQTNDSKRSKNKDKIASIILALLFLASSIWVEIESVKSFLEEEKPLKSFVFIGIAIFQSILFSILSIIKFLLAQKLVNNVVIISDGVNSIIASLSNLSMAISMIFFIANNNIWYLDSIFGFIIGILVFIYGTQLLMKNVCFLDDEEEIE